METCTDDNIFAIAQYLQPTEIVNLAFVCKRFGAKQKALSKSKRKSNQSISKQQYDYPWSMMEEASRRRVSSAKNDRNNQFKDSGFLTIHGEEESWIAVDQRSYLLQHSLAFSTILGKTIKYVNGDITHIQVRRRREGSITSWSGKEFPIAICQQVMKSGVHCVAFQVTERGSIGLGIIRPTLRDWPKKKMTHSDFMNFCRRAPAVEGSPNQFFDCMENLKKGDTIQLKLDLNKGVLTFYKNNERYSVISSQCYGLIGHYCWAAVAHGDFSTGNPSIRIRPLQSLG